MRDLGQEGHRHDPVRVHGDDREVVLREQLELAACLVAAVELHVQHRQPGAPARNGGVLVDELAQLVLRALELALVTAQLETDDAERLERVRLEAVPGRLG